MLGFAFAVAALAVSGAMWVLDEAPAGTAPGADDEIRAELYRYARANADWSSVAPLVEDLARRTGRRIMLTDADGRVIADSARLPGNGGGAPTGPSTVVDASAPLGYAEEVSEPGEGVGLAYRGFHLTGNEQRQRDALVADAIDCLRGDPGLGRPSLRQFTTVGLFGGDGSGLPGMSCVPKELAAPSAENRRLNDEAVARVGECLDGHGLAYEVLNDGRGLEWLSPPRGATGSPQWTDCERSARTASVQGVTAPPAALRLATAEPDATTTDRWAVAGVLLAVSVLAVLFARNLAAPMAAAQGRERRRRELIGDLAHELRTPLTTVRSQLEAAEAELLPLDASLVRSLHEEASRMARLVSDMDDLGLAEAGTLRLRARSHDITDPAKEVLAEHRASTDGVQLRLDAPAPVRVHADPARIRQALGNLVANAVRHTPPGGTVTVSVRTEGAHAVLTVADTGTGIPTEDLPHVFERFHRDGSGGSGLGLAITARIVEAHGGSIRLSSTPGAGTSAVIRLPLDLTTS